MVISPVFRPFLAAAALVGLTPMPAEALILYGRTNAENLTPPANGAPWSHATRIGLPNASGVYLGNGFVLTANHVDDSGNATNQIRIDNQIYTRNTTWLTANGSVQWLQIVSGNVSIDAKVLRINGNPSLPALSPLPISMDGTDDDTGADCTIIGSGTGKGNQTGNTWAWDMTFASATQRWGLNTTDGSVLLDGGVEYLLTAANSNRGSDEATATLGDSGCPLFISYNGTWKLAGLTVGAEDAANRTSTFGIGPAADSSYYIRLASYAHLLRFDHWRNHHLGNASAPYTGDTDQDGLPNLLEYAFDGNPALADGDRAPVGGFETVLGIDYVTLTYWHRRTATDITLTVEESTDAVNWSPATVTPVVLVGNSAAIPVWKIKARVDAGTAGRKILRLRVTLL